MTAVRDVVSPDFFCSFILAYAAKFLARCTGGENELKNNLVVTVFSAVLVLLIFQ